MSNSVVAQRALTRQYKTLMSSDDPNWYASYDEDSGDMYKCYFCFRGPDDTPFEDGWYFGCFHLPSQFPFKPPRIVMLTPSGRLEVGKSICTTFSVWHGESWSPAWGLDKLIVGMRSFFADDVKGAGHGIGALHASDDEKRRLANLSMDYNVEQHDVFRRVFRDAIETRIAMRLSQTETSSGKRNVSDTAETDDASSSSEPPKKKVRSA